MDVIADFERRLVVGRVVPQMSGRDANPIVMERHETVVDADMNETQLLADRMVVMEEGQVAREGTTAEVMALEVILSRARSHGLSAQNILPSIVSSVQAGDGQE